MAKRFAQRWHSPWLCPATLNYANYSNSLIFFFFLSLSCFFFFAPPDFSWLAAPWLESRPRWRKTATRKQFHWTNVFFFFGTTYWHVVSGSVKHCQCFDFERESMWSQSRHFQTWQNQQDVNKVLWVKTQQMNQFFCCSCQKHMRAGQFSLSWHIQIRVRLPPPLPKKEDSRDSHSSQLSTRKTWHCDCSGNNKVTLRIRGYTVYGISEC